VAEADAFAGFRDFPIKLRAGMVPENCAIKAQAPTIGERLGRLVGMLPDPGHCHEINVVRKIEPTGRAVPSSAVLPLRKPMARFRRFSNCQGGRKRRRVIGYSACGGLGPLPLRASPLARSES
jgi:hypothetical protein